MKGLEVEMVNGKEDSSLSVSKIMLHLLIKKLSYPREIFIVTLEGLRQGQHHKSRINNELAQSNRKKDRMTKCFQGHRVMILMKLQVICAVTRLQRVIPTFEE